MTSKFTNKPISKSIKNVLKESFLDEIVLSPRDSKRFLAALITPPKPNQKLIKAMEKFRKMTENNR
jgi:uncharacterized protein (DUF1778 family)